jgi:hypothetical protein
MIFSATRLSPYLRVSREQYLCAPLSAVISCPNFYICGLICLMRLLTTGCYMLFGSSAAVTVNTVYHDNSDKELPDLSPQLSL